MLRFITSIGLSVGERREMKRRRKKTEEKRRELRACGEGNRKRGE